MLKFSNFVMAKWWVFLLFGAVLLSAYAAIFGLYPDLLGWHFDKVLNVTTVTLLLALVVTALVYILNSDHKTKKKRTLWTVLFNIPLGVVGIGLVFLMAEGNPSPYRAAYSKQVKSICAVSESNVSDGEQYDAVLSDALEIANALSTTMDKYGRYDLFVDTDEKTGISRIEIQDSYSSCVSSELTGFDYTSRGRNGVSALTCEAGDGQSCLKQSKDIFTGYGYQEKDKDKVLGLVSKACDLEAQDSCFWLGIQYEGNHGFIYEDYFKENNPDLILFKSLKTDGTDAKRYFEKSCSLGNDIGCQFASLVDDRPAPVENCDPEEKDSRNFDQNMACSAFDMDNLAYEMKGNHLAENFVNDKACRSGNDEKCFSMAVGYTMKLFFPADLAKTAEYYRIGCDNGSNVLCSYLASAYNKGEGVKKNASMGLDFNKRACDGGYSSACNSAGIAFYRGKSGVEVNLGEAVKYFKKACDSGIAMGCNNLGSTYEKGGKGISEDINMALKYYTQACDDDLASACNSLGAIYFIGKKMPQNKNEGRKYMKKACDLDKNECGFYNAAK